MLLVADSVCKTFGKTLAVQDVSFTIPTGEICGFLGPNGAGKTTLIRMIMDILRPDSGEIRLGDGLEGSRKSHIGYLPEERGLYAKVKVRETLLYFARLKGQTAKAAAANVDHFLDLLKMTHTANTRVDKLSKGNQQKIQLIAAIVSKPRLLILDEPFTGLDPINLAMVSACIESLKEDGTTIILSTHQMNQAESFCDHIFLFNMGSLILDDKLSDLVTRYSGRFLMVECEGSLPPNEVFEPCSTEGVQHKIALRAGKTMRDLLFWLAEQEISVHSVRPFRVPLSEIFIREVRQHG